MDLFAERMRSGSIVLLYTGYGDVYQDHEAYFGSNMTGADSIPYLHFPGLSPDAAKWLIDYRCIAAVGIDTASIDFGRSTELGTHRFLSERGIPIFENLANLRELAESRRNFNVIALPQKIAQATGAPLRIVAVLDKKDFNAHKLRSGKVRQVWEKANRIKLPGFEMTELYSELLLHDEMLMEHKRTRNENDDGNKDAELTERLLAIMEKYGLAGKKPAYDGRKAERMKHRFLEDPKLDKLWQTVKKNGKFSDEELQTLENEFQHHRRKLYELESLKSEISDIDELHDNSVEKQLIQDTRSEKKQKVAELYGDIAEGYERLSLKAKQGALSADSVPFTEPRVAQLWEEAKNAGFSDEELESIKEELNHFQIKVQKHLFFKDQLKNSVEKIDNYGGHDKAPKPQADTHSHLQKKVKELASKVKKLHHRISQKLSSGSQDRGEL